MVLALLAIWRFSYVCLTSATIPSRYHAHVLDGGRVVGFITRPRFIRYCARLKQQQWRRRKWQRERQRQRRHQRLHGTGLNKKVVLGSAKEPAAHPDSSTYFYNEDSLNNGDGAPPTPFLKPQVPEGASARNGQGPIRNDLGTSSTNLDQKARLMRRQSRR